MKKVKLLMLVLMTTLIFAGCAKNGALKTPTEGTKTNTGANVTENSSTSPNGEVSPSNNPMRDYFLPDGSKANYKGEGNEFAQLKIVVAQPYENYFVIHENNGGAFIQRIYKIETDKISIVKETMIDAKQEFPTLVQLEALKPIGVYLQKPFSVGSAFGDWTIVQTGLTIDTPFKTFDDAFVIEKKDKDSVIRKYFVQGFGEVKRESIMKSANGEEFIVTSTLESVTK